MKLFTDRFATRLTTRLSEGLTTMKKEVVEQKIESSLEKVFSHPLFLKGVCQVIDVGVNTKKIKKVILKKIWNDLELPNKNDQEKTLALVNELQCRIDFLESELRKTKPDAEVLSIKKKRKSECLHPA